LKLSIPFLARLRRCCRAVLSVLLVTVALLAPSPAAAEPSPSLRLAQAEFAPAATGPWTPVALPDTWSRRGRPGPGRGFYRIEFELAARPEGLWALRFERLSTHHELRVNGELVSGALPVAVALPRRPIPLLATVPPALLRAGRNRIEIEVDNGVRAGLSAIEIGPAAAVEHDFLTGYHLDVTLPQMLNVASGGVCLLMLFLWWRRRAEVAVGSFAVLGLLTSARNVAYYRVDTAWPVALVDFLYFAAQVASVVLLGFFAMALAARRPRGLRAALLGGGALALTIGAAAAATQQMHLARALTYPLLLLLALPSLALVARRAREMRTPALLGLLAALVLVLGAGVHDYFYQQGHTSVMDGYWLPFAVPVALVAFAGGLLQRVVGALRQVEELNQTLEQRVRERTHELQLANQAKTRFIAAAGHDLRQPVATIGLLLGLLREQIAEPAQRALAQRAEDAVVSMEALLSGLLDLSRLESGTLRPRLKNVPLQPLFDAIASHAAEAARRKGLVLRIRPTRLAVRSDPLLLEQILRNFVANALRYTDGGGVLLAARAAGDGGVRLQVWDTGRGIPADRQAAVFDEFVQLEPGGSERHQGLGLGLAIVRRSAALLGAPIGLVSRPGRGSCFELRVPRVGANRVAAAAGVARPETGDPLLTGLDVVLVDDDAAVREALSARLVAWGAQVHAFDAPHSLRLALDALPPLRRRAGLLITDQRLPGGSGLDVVEIARRRFGTLPALVITGDTAPQDLARLAASGLAVLHKPFRADQLRAAIRAVLSA